VRCVVGEKTNVLFVVCSEVIPPISGNESSGKGDLSSQALVADDEVQLVKANTVYESNV